MKGSDAARALRAAAEVVRLRDELTPEEAAKIAMTLLGAETLSQKRARAGREGGLRSVALRVAETGSAAPKQTRSKPEASAEAPPKQTRSKPPFASEANGEANPKQTPPVSSPPLHSPSSLPPRNPKEIIVVSKEPDSSVRERAPEANGTTTAPRSYAEAIQEPLCSRALLVIGNPTLANLLGVERWPEVLEVARVWHQAGGRSGEPRVTGGVAEALCKLWAKGFMPGDVLRVARHLPTTDGFRDKVLPSCLTENVVAIALGELESAGTGMARAIVQRVRGGGPQTSPQPIGASLGRFVAGGQP